MYSDDVRGWCAGSSDSVHDHDQQHDHDDPVVRLRDDNHQHDDGTARLHRRVYMGRGAEPAGRRHVGVEQEDGPVRFRVSVPTADNEPLLQHRLDAVRDHDDDHDARALVLRIVRVLVGAGPAKVDLPQLDVQPGLSGVSMHAAVRAWRPVPRDDGSVRGSRNADDYDHDGAAAVLAVLHDDHQQHDDHDGRPVRCRVLRLGLATIAWAVVPDRVLVPVTMPVRDA